MRLLLLVFLAVIALSSSYCGASWLGLGDNSENAGVLSLAFVMLAVGAVASLLFVIVLVLGAKKKSGAPPP